MYNSHLYVTGNTGFLSIVGIGISLKIGFIKEKKVGQSKDEW